MADVKWGVDIDVDAVAAKAADAVVGKLEKTLKSAEASAHKTGKSVEEGFKGVGKSIDETKGKVKEFFEFVGAVAAFEILEKIADKMAEIGKEAIKSAAHAERMNRVIDSASGGKAEGKENREWLEKFAGTGEQSEAESEGAFVGLKRVGSTDKNAKTAMLAAADIAAVSEDKHGAFNEAVSAFARLQRTGKVSNRTLAPLGLGEKDFKALPEYAKLSSKQLKKKMETGSVTSEDLQRLIMAHTGEKAIGEKGADNADLLETKLEKLSELPERFYKKLADTTAVKKLTGELDGILSKLDPGSPTGKKISTFLTGVFEEAAHLAGQLGEAIDGIDWDEMADTIKTDVMPVLREMVALLGPAMHMVDVTIKGLHEGARLLNDPLGVARDVATGKITKSAHQQLAEKGTLPSTQEHGLAGDLTGATLLDKYTPIGYLRDTVLNPDWWSTKAQAIPDGVAAGIKEGTPEVEAAASDMGAASDAAFRSPDGIHAQSPSKKFRRSGRDVIDGYTLGLTEGADRIGDAMDSTATNGFDVGRGRDSTAGSSLGMSVTIAEGAIQINVAGHGDSGEIARAVEERLQKSAGPIFIDWLERAKAGAGR